MKTVQQIAAIVSLISFAFLALVGWAITVGWIMLRIQDKWWAPILGFILFIAGIFVAKFVPQPTKDDDRISKVEERLQALEGEIL